MTGLIVAGMHRSGTSLLARLLSDGGWHPGETLPRRPGEEYFEDATFVGIHRAWIDACVPPGDGHLDWGVSTEGAPDVAKLGDVSSVVDEFHLRREMKHHRWVAKDPRVTLFLDRWVRLESLKFVLVYRSPWDVVDSCVRLGHPEFCRSPSIIRRAWLLYNRRLLDFATRHRDRCVLISSESLVADIGAAWTLLDAVVGLEGAHGEGLVDGSRMATRDRHHPVAALTRLLHPECVEVLDALDALADLPRPVGVARRQPFTPEPGGSLPSGVGVQVVIPCRDDGDFLDEALASVDAGCSGPTELTIVDDGSTDPETLRIIDALRTDGRHVVVTSGVGLSAARNAGMRTSNTLAVLPLDADNRVLPTLLAAIPLLERGEADVVHGPWEEFGLRRNVVQPPDASLMTLLPVNTIDACALIRRTVLDDIGGYDESLPHMEDWDVWLAALAIGARFRRLTETTFRYLVRPGSLTASVWADEVRLDATFERILGKHESITGAHTARLVQQLVRSRKDLELMHHAADARAEDAAQHAAAIDADRARLAAQLHQERLDNAAALTSVQEQPDHLVDELSAQRVRRSARLFDSAAQRLARHPRLMSIVGRSITRRDPRR